MGFSSFRPPKITLELFFEEFTYESLSTASESHVIVMGDLKVVSAAFLLVSFSSLKESYCETWKNVFYFISKALFILEKIKF